MEREQPLMENVFEIAQTTVLAMQVNFNFGVTTGGVQKRKRRENGIRLKDFTIRIFLQTGP